MPAIKPTGLTIRAYQVGFGDCFLLSWQYPNKERHVLIDFGSNGQPKSAPKSLLKAVAADIKTRCGGKLDAIVLTHRHKDHIAGFATNDGKGPGDIIKSLDPDVVVQPWTEDPKAKPNAKQATQTMTGKQAFVSSLASMNEVSAGVIGEAKQLSETETTPWRQRFFSALAFLGEEGIQNESAVRNLQEMGRRHAYVSHGSKSGLESVLPGVKITVLGPPTLKQSADIQKERSKDVAEFWMLQANAGKRLVAGGQRVFPDAAVLSVTRPPPWARWFIPRVRAMRANSLLSIVRIMDDAMNNTSVILLFEVNGKSFLFPGDAQIENWEFTLKQAALMKRLANVTFYKVGHHGSRNATPKSLWKNFVNRGPEGTADRLRTVMSTMGGKYGKIGEGTEVPRQTLLRALRAETDFSSTQSLRGKKLSQDIEIQL